jgi:hypothetical protein
MSYAPHITMSTLFFGDGIHLGVPRKKTNRLLCSEFSQRHEHCIRGLRIKFTDWCKKNKNYKETKIVLLLFKAISAYLNTVVESLKKFLKTVGKGLQRNSVQFGRQCLQHPETSLLWRQFHKMQSRKLELSWQVWMKSWQEVSLRCFCSSVSLRGTNFAHIFLFCESS